MSVQIHILVKNDLFANWLPALRSFDTAQRVGRDMDETVQNKVQVIDDVVRISPVSTQLNSLGLFPILAIYREWNENLKSIILRYEIPKPVEDGILVGQNTLLQASQGLDEILGDYGFRAKIYWNQGTGVHLGVFLVEPQRVLLVKGDPSISFRYAHIDGRGFLAVT